MGNAQDIRNFFLHFFDVKNHKIASSAPIIQHNDPTLMFVNAGMVPLKHFFTGELKADHINVASCQKCLRAGGKHNDLENVGYTDRHHTFFEMLGNFSFGGYFKEQAILMAWEFINKNLGIDASKLMVTVYHTDQESREIWSKLVSNVVSVETDDNFWRMGDVGPCGPCSEVFYRLSDDKFLEIWNLVFMQHYDDGSGNLVDLPSRCIDTGMGLERLLSVVEGVWDNYKTSLFVPLIEASMELSGNSDNQIAHRVIADHLRASAFLISDGLYPGNTGKEYVLRRIIRRAIRYVHKIVKSDSPKFLSLLVEVLRDLMSEQYNQLDMANDLIVQTLSAEEEKFWDTLSRGMTILNKEMDRIIACGTLEGGLAFKLYDTYGFPLDLTQDIMREKGLKVDLDGFNQAMNSQKQKNIWQGSGELYEKSLWLSLYKNFGATEFFRKDSHLTSHVLSIVNKGELVEFVDSHNEALELILDKTVFYAESGGQQGDKGFIESESLLLRVDDTKKVSGGLVIHYCILIKGKVSKGDLVKLKLDEKRRRFLSINHSATHLLHCVLRKILGESVAQKGSLVTAEYLRFDFSHNRAVGKSELRLVESEVYKKGKKAIDVSVETLGRDEALHKGAIALFGEKYGDKVRVVSIGDSVELCGGTHVGNTSEIGLFKIAEESSVGQGIRRIKALAGDKAWEYMVNSVDELEIELEQTMEEAARVKKQLEKENSALYTRIFNISSLQALDVKGGIKLSISQLDDFPIRYLRTAVINNIKKQHNLVVITGARSDKKTILLIAVTQDLQDHCSAQVILKRVIQSLSIDGGGNRSIAQAGGFNWFDFDKIKNNAMDFFA